MELVHGLPRRLLDALEGGGRTGGVHAQHRAGRGGLHAHHRHVVRDGVVQLAREPEPLDRDRLPLDELALELELPATPGGACTLARRRPGVVTEVVGAREVQDVGEHLDEQERDEGRERAGTGDARHRVRVRHGDEDGREQPHEHADDDDQAHPGRAAPVGVPRTHRVERHEERDVGEERLGDLEDARGDEGDRREQHDGAGPPAAPGQRGRDREEAQDRRPGGRGVVVDPRGRREHEAQQGPDEQTTGEQGVGTALVRAERCASPPGGVRVGDGRHRRHGGLGGRRRRGLRRAAVTVARASGVRRVRRAFHGHTVTARAPRTGRGVARRGSMRRQRAAGPSRLARVSRGPPRRDRGCTPRRARARAGRASPSRAPCRSRTAGCATRTRRRPHPRARRPAAPSHPR